MGKQIVTRLMDAALIAALVFGSADVKTFAFWMVAIMVVLLFLGAFAVDAALAEKIHSRSFAKKTFGVFVHALYVCALIYAGFPILAALYAVTASFIRFVSQHKLNTEAAQ